jgi:hypothetical protein
MMHHKLEARDLDSANAASPMSTKYLYGYALLLMVHLAKPKMTSFTAVFLLLIYNYN